MGGGPLEGGGDEKRARACAMHWRVVCRMCARMASVRTRALVEDRDGQLPLGVDTSAKLLLYAAALPDWDVDRVRAVLLEEAVEDSQPNLRPILLARLLEQLPHVHGTTGTAHARSGASREGATARRVPACCLRTRAPGPPASTPDSLTRARRDKISESISATMRAPHASGVVRLEWRGDATWTREWGVTGQADGPSLPAPWRRRAAPSASL